MQTDIHFWSYLDHFFLAPEILQANLYRKSEHRFYVQNFFSRKSCRLWNNVEKYGACALRAGLLNLQTHTLRICNTYCFSAATMFARTPLNITLYVQSVLLSLNTVVKLWIDSSPKKCVKLNDNHKSAPSPVSDAITVLLWSPLKFTNHDEDQSV
jgi:hypothetical protein